MTPNDIKLYKMKMKGAMLELIALEKKNKVLLKGNFAPIAKRHGLKVAELKGMWGAYQIKLEQENK